MSGLGGDAKIATVRRYPVKSMLGEDLHEIEVGPDGLQDDRRFALIDVNTGMVVTAKHPRLWRRLLKYAATADGTVTIILPSGHTMPAVEGPNQPLSMAMLRPLALSAKRFDGAAVERADPEQVIEQGVMARVEAPQLVIAQGAPNGTSFVDYAPVHLITTASLAAVGADGPDMVRYRPNLVVQTPEGTPPFVENDWTGKEIRVGDVVLRGILPTPRCAVPTLEHGDLPRSVDAVRTLLERNRVDVPGFGNLPCLGAYAEVVSTGTVRVGDQVTVD